MPLRSLLRTIPIEPSPEGEKGGLERRMGTIPLMMLGIGATVGTGVFFVMHEAVPVAGPATVIAFLLAALAAGLSALCYAEMASAVPASGSTYTYAYATLGELAAVVVAACLLLEYGVSTAAVAVGWSGYLNLLLDNTVGIAFPAALSANPWDAAPGILNLPAVILVVLCALLLMRGVTESARVNVAMVVIKLAVLLLFAAVALTAFEADNFADFAPAGAAGVTAAAGTIFFTFIGLDAVSTAGGEAKDPRRSLPRAILGALAVVTALYILVAVAAIGSQPWQAYSDPEQQSVGLAVIVENVTGAAWPGTLLALGAVISIFSVTLVVMYGQTRVLYTMGRDGLVPKFFAKVHPRTKTPVNTTIVVAIAVGLLAAFVPLDGLWDLVSIGTLVAFIVVAVAVLVLRRKRPDLPRGFRVPFGPVIPILSIATCLVVLSGLGLVTFAWFGAWVGVALLYYAIWGRKSAARARARD